MPVLEIRYQVQFPGRTHLGGGEGEAGVSRAIRRGGDGAPVLAGSHLKGHLREQCEGLSRLMASEGDPSDPLMPYDPHAADAASARRHAARDARTLIARLFGDKARGGALIVEDAHLTPGDTPDQLERRRQVMGRMSMDRLLGRPRARRLFSSEYITDLSFEGRILAMPMPDEVTTFHAGGLSPWPVEWAVLVAGLRGIERMGGDKSSGAGRCEVIIPEGQMRARQGLIGGWTPVSTDDILAPLLHLSSGLLYQQLERHRLRGPATLAHLAQTAADALGDALPGDAEEWAIVEDLAQDSGGAS